MGRWVVVIIIIGGIFAGGVMLWLKSHQHEFQTLTLQGLTSDFQREKDSILSALPADEKLDPQASWAFSFAGDELFISAPELTKPSGTLDAGDFERARAALMPQIDSWLSRHPGDRKKFPVHLKFRNESSP